MFVKMSQLLTCRQNSKQKSMAYYPIAKSIQNLSNNKHYAEVAFCMRKTCLLIPYKI